MFCGNCGKELNGNKNCQNCLNTPSNVEKIDNGNLNKKQKRIISMMIFVVMFLIIVLIVESVLNNNKTSLSKNAENPSRTVMIYMVGSNLETDASIATSDIYSIDPERVDLENIKILLYTGGTEKWHSFVQNDENAIYELREEGFIKVKQYPMLNMGDSKTLADFINYGYENYKTSKYDLILYNHGGAIDGAIYDDFSKDNLTPIEFREALSKTKFNKNNKLETVLFRTCLNGTLEIANIFSDYAEYLVASEEITNGATGESVLNFLNEISKQDSTIDYGKKYIEAYDNQMQNLFVPYDLPMMYSIIDLNKIDKLNKELEKFISSIDLEKNYNNIVRMRAKLFQFGYTYYDDSTYDMVDLYSLINELKDISSVDAKPLLNLIKETIVYNWASSDEFHGLSVYFPYRGNKQVQKQWLNIYQEIGIADSYTKLIKDFNNYSTSNRPSSYKDFSNKDSVKIENKSEFTMTLTEEQKNDYASSIYILFAKQENGKFKAIYSSDNSVLDGNTLKTNISNNLIKVYDTKTSESSFLMISERSNNNKKTISTGAVLTDIEDTSSFRITASKAFFEFKDDGSPYVKSYIHIGDKKAAGSIIDVSSYQYANFLISDYKILDDKGNYTSAWDNEGIISGVELKLSDLEFRRATLDESVEYYCIFNIRDVYGNSYYSNLLSIN